MSGRQCTGEPQLGGFLPPSAGRPAAPSPAGARGCNLGNDPSPPTRTAGWRPPRLGPRHTPAPWRPRRRCSWHEGMPKGGPPGSGLLKDLARRGGYSSGFFFFFSLHSCFSSIFPHWVGICDKKTPHKHHFFFKITWSLWEFWKSWVF